MQAQAERVEDRQHLGEPYGGLAALQLNEKTNSDPGGGRQLVLTEALCKRACRTMDPTFWAVMKFPIGKIMPRQESKVGK